MTDQFQWAPTLGGECYVKEVLGVSVEEISSFNGHPPLGVNATCETVEAGDLPEIVFQWAPTLGGECYPRATS